MNPPPLPLWWGNMWGKADGQIMFIFVLTLAAAEAAIGLAILLQFIIGLEALMSIMPVS